MLRTGASLSYSVSSLSFDAFSVFGVAWSVPSLAMGNYSSALYADVEEFKAIISSPDHHLLENATLNHISDTEEPLVWSQNEPDLSDLKFLHCVQEPSREIPEADAVATSESSAVSSRTNLKPKLNPHGPPTLQRLREEVQDMRGELELLKSQHKKEIKLMMNELDEEKKMRLSLQVEVDRLKRRFSK